MSHSKNLYILFWDDKIFIIKDFLELKKKVLEKNSSKIIGEVMCNKSNEIIHIFKKLKFINRWSISIK